MLPTYTCQMERKPKLIYSHMLGKTPEYRKGGKTHLFLEIFRSFSFRIFRTVTFFLSTPRVLRTLHRRSITQTRTQILCPSSPPLTCHHHHYPPQSSTNKIRRKIAPDTFYVGFPLAARRRHPFAFLAEFDGVEGCRGTRAVTCCIFWLI